MAGLQGVIPNIIGAASYAGDVLSYGTAAQNLFSSAEDQRRDELRAQQDLTLAQLQAQQKLQQKQVEANAALRKQEIQAKAVQDEKDRQSALRRAVARQNARFGAGGISSGSGSSEAVLLGLFQESETEKQRREELDTLRAQAIDLDVAQSNSLNVLQRTQLQQKQQLQRAQLPQTSGSLFGSLF